MKASRPLWMPAQIIVTIILIVIGILTVLLLVNSEFPKSLGSVKETVVITKTSNGICEIQTSDNSFPIKIIPNCNLEEGTQINISYQKGLPYARILAG